MTKKITLVIIVIASIIALSVFYLVNENEPVADSLYRAVPLDASLLIEVKNYDKFYNNLIVSNPLWNEISNIPFLSKLKVQVEVLDSMRKTNVAMNTLLAQNEPVLISGHATGKDNIQLIYYFRLTSDNDFKQLNKQMLNYKGTMLEHNTRTYEQAEIHDISFPSQKNNNFAYTHTSGILIVSQSAILLEDAVRQLTAKESVINNRELHEAMKSAGKNSLLNIYFNFEQFPRLAMKLIHPKYRKSIDFVKKFGQWIELDLNPKPGTLIFNGFSFADPDKSSIASLFKNQKPLKLDIFTKIPTLANTFAAIGISDLTQYIADYELFQETYGNSQTYKSELQSLKTDYNIDLIESIKTVFDQEVSVVFMGETFDSIPNEAFTVMKVKGNDEAHNMLYDFVSEYAAKLGIKTTSLVADYKMNDQSRKIYSLPFGNIPALVFGDLFSTGDNKVCAVIDNYLIFSNNADALNNFTNTVSDGLTLGSDPDFINFSEFFSSQTNFFFYNKPALSRSFYANFLKTNIVDILKGQQSHFNRFNTFVYQFNTSNNGLIYNNIFIRYSDENIDNSKVTLSEPEVLKRAIAGSRKEILLDGKPIIKPVFLKDGNDLEIFVQDDKNQIYMIDKFGKISWKIKLNNPIISDIALIDYYKNGKLQLLFNTSKQLILIDRKGNFVEKYPVTFKSTATNAVAVLDYENERNYRFFIAHNNQSVSCLDKDGKLINGWNFVKTESVTNKPVQHFRIEGKDFLAFTDNKMLYVLDRKGNEAVNLKSKITVSQNCKIAVINSKSLLEARFVVTDASGKVNLISLDGSVKVVDYGTFPANHYFDVYDVNADGVKEFIFTYDNQLKVYSQNAKLLSIITIDKPISARPTFYEFATNKYKVGIVSTLNEKIYLYNLDGKIEKGFPLQGASQFSIKLLNNSENRLNLVVGSSTNFLYNYWLR